MKKIFKSINWVLIGYVLVIVSTILFRIRLPYYPPFCLNYFENIFGHMRFGSLISVFVLSIYFMLKPDKRKHGIILFVLLIFAFIFIYFFSRYFGMWDWSGEEVRSRLIVWCTNCNNNVWPLDIEFSDEIKNVIICEEYDFGTLPENCASAREFCRDFIPID